MKKLFTLFLPLFLASTIPVVAENTPPPAAPSGESGSITVHVKGLNKAEGQLGVALYTNQKGFPDKTEHAFLAQVHKITSTGEMTVVFENVPYGSYAVSVLHDENSNGKMDKTFFGIPKEGFGVSNNPKIRRGPPIFSESLFTLNAKQLELTITLNYL